MTLGEKIRNRRQELNLTLDDLGKVLGVQRSAINKYEKGIVDPKVSQIRALASALDLPILYLLDDSAEKGEAELLEAWRNADDRAREDAMETLLKHQKKDTIEMVT